MLIVASLRKIVIIFSFCSPSQILSSIFAASFHIVVGIALSYSAVLIPQIESQGEISDVDNKTLTSLVASIIVLVVPLGSIMAGYLMDKFGRVNTIKLAAIPSVIGWILIATAPNIYWILAGRIFTGIACAVGSSPAVVYITEVARPDLRGSLISAGPTIASLGKINKFNKFH
jgi:MFS family permease